MAEAIAALGVVASVAQLADYGFSLSVKLFTFSQAVYSADQSIKTISNDVSLTSTVLKELSHIIGSDEAHLISEAAFQATKQAVTECLAVFKQLSTALDKSLTNLGLLEVKDEKKKAKRGTIALEKLKWPFKQSKMELLRSNLDRLKASLTLMLQVLSYAREVSNRKVAETSLAYQQHLIESLARSEQTSKRKYLALEKALEIESSQMDFHATINTAVQVPSHEIDRHRSISPDRSPNPPPVKPRTLIGELLMCYNILMDLLQYKEVIMGHRNLHSSSIVILCGAWDKSQAPDLKRLESDYGDMSDDIRTEAANNLQARMKELAKNQSLKQRSVEQGESRENSLDLEPEVAESLPYRVTLTAEGRATIQEHGEQLYTSEDMTGHPQLDTAIMHAKRRRRASPLAVIFTGVPKAAARAIRHASQSAYKAGSSLFRHSKKQTQEIHQSDDSHFKHGKALDYPEIPGEEHRNAALFQIREQYRRTTEGSPAKQHHRSSSIGPDSIVEGSSATPIAPGGLMGPKPVAIDSEECLIDYSEEEEVGSHENVVENLLSAWTNLPARQDRE